jgi:hypothetical protein
MPDISKCNGNNCPIKEKCHRYTITSSFRQYWTNFEFNNVTQSCVGFWENGNEK